VHPFDGAPRDAGISQIAFHELYAWKVAKISALACAQIVDHPDAMTAPDELLSEMGSDEAGAAGYEIGRHGGLNWVIWSSGH
jgi:hypothetical protein